MILIEVVIALIAFLTSGCKPKSACHVTGTDTAWNLILGISFVVIILLNFWWAMVSRDYILYLRDSVPFQDELQSSQENIPKETVDPVKSISMPLPPPEIVNLDKVRSGITQITQTESTSTQPSETASTQNDE